MRVPYECVFKKWLVFFLYLLLNPRCNVRSKRTDNMAFIFWNLLSFFFLID